MDSVVDAGCTGHRPNGRGRTTMFLMCLLTLSRVVQCHIDDTDDVLDDSLKSTFYDMDGKKAGEGSSGGYVGVSDGASASTPTTSATVSASVSAAPGTGSNGFCGQAVSVPPDADNLVWTEPATRLLPLIADPTRYNKFLAPGQLNGSTTTVSVALYIESMSAYRAQTTEFEVDLYLALSWNDPRLVHDCVHPVLLTDPNHLQMLWTPDLYFVNSKAAHVHLVTAPNNMVLAYGDGLIFKSMRIGVTLSCDVKLERFPMDAQKCPIQIQSYAYVEKVVNLTWFINEEAGYPISRNLKIKLNNMDVTNTTVDEGCVEYYPMFRGAGNWSCVRASILLKRFVTFHVFHTYVPTAMLVAISWLSFWLDIRASPARISLTITTLLTLTTMGNSVRQDLPQVSYVKAIDVWLSVCTGFVFCVLLEYTAVNYFIGQKTSGCALHTRMQTFAHSSSKASRPQVAPIVVTEYTRSCGVCIAKWERRARNVDNSSRLLFPLVFGVFITVYWCLCKFAPWVFDNSN